MACRKIDASEGSPCNEDASSIGQSKDDKSYLREAQVVLSEEEVHTRLKARIANTHYLDREIRVVLIGKTGVGKSATANMIIGKDYFKSESGGPTVTKECNKIHTRVFGREILVVDTPGLFDQEADPHILKEEIRKCITIAAPGPHAILFVMKLSDRYKKEDHEALITFCSYFGEKMLDHVIVIFTHADIIQNEKITLETYIDKSPLQLKQLLQYCGSRTIAFNNKFDLIERELQVECLLSMIDALKSRNKIAAYCRDKNFEIAENEMKVREELPKKEYSEKIEKGEKEILQRRPIVRELVTTKQRPAVGVTGSRLTLDASSLSQSKDDKSYLREAQVVLSEEEVHACLKARIANTHYLDREIRVVLVGKSGVGKSATANMIIGKDYFKSESEGATVTKECNKIHTRVFGREILVVDTPGILDIETDPHILKEEIRKCVTIAAPGPHAILFVMKLSVRYRKEDYEALITFCSYFGEKMLDHVIIIFTHADIIQNEKITLEAYIDKSPPQLKELLQYFGSRTIALNNKFDLIEGELQVECLLTMIDAVKSRNTTAAYCRDKNFEIAENEMKVREELLKKEYSEKIEKGEKEILQRRPIVRELVTTKQRTAMGMMVSRLTLHPHCTGKIPKPANFEHKMSKRT